MKQKFDWNFVLTLFGFMVVLWIGLFIEQARMQNDLNKKDVEIEELQFENRELQMERDSVQKEIDDLHDVSIENVEYWLDTLEIAHKDVVMKQILLETGNLSSPICRYNHNLFGMKEPRIRETTALGTKRGHAYYANYIDSIKDYKLWQEDRNVNTQMCYYTFLSSVGYAEAPNYIQALKSI